MGKFACFHGNFDLPSLLSSFLTYLCTFFAYKLTKYWINSLFIRRMMLHFSPDLIVYVSFSGHFPAVSEMLNATRLRLQRQIDSCGDDEQLIR